MFFGERNVKSWTVFLCAFKQSASFFYLQPSTSNWTLLRPTRTWRWKTWVWSGTAVEERCRTSAKKRTEPTPRCTRQPGLWECELAASLNLHFDYRKPHQLLFVLKNKAIKILNIFVHCLESGRPWCHLREPRQPGPAETGLQQSPTQFWVRNTQQTNKQNPWTDPV